MLVRINGWVGQIAPRTKEKENGGASFKRVARLLQLGETYEWRQSESEKLETDYCIDLASDCDRRYRNHAHAWRESELVQRCGQILPGGGRRLHHPVFCFARFGEGA